jgi:predicted nucleic acid-binding protein
VSYLLDTNVVAEVRKARPHAGVAAWFESVPGSELYLSVLVVGEIEQGIARLCRRNPRQAGAYQSWLGRLRHEFADRLLPVTEGVAMEWGRLNAARPSPAIDALMAATAIVHGLTVVTRNVDDFAPTGVAVLNPFA